MVYNLALRLSGNPADAQDIVQDVFIKALRGLEALREEKAAGGWLYRITVNVWKNRVRGEKRRSIWKMLSLDWDGDNGDKEPLQVKSPEPAADEAIEKLDEKSALEKGLAELDPEDRAILVLREIEGLSYQEISEIMVKPLGTVKSGISRAREALRLKMGPLLK